MTTSEVAKRYFHALNEHDLDRAVACWAPGAVDRISGREELIAPHGVRDYFAELLGAFPDMSFEVVDLTTSKSRTAVRWRGRGTFAGPGRFQGLMANGARVEIEGCDVMTVADDLIQTNEAYMDSASVARRLGVLPPAGSVTESRLTQLVNLRTKLTSKLSATEPVRIADGVWLVRGGLPTRTMNVYLIEDEGGVTVFDAGIAAMANGIASAAARLGGIKRVVLGHADADHRGAAPRLGAPVLCHPAEREAARSASPYRSYFDFSKLDPHGRLLLRRLFPAWDGGPVDIAGTVSEGDAVAGFKVIDLPGHAPGLIGLYREDDRLALVSDCIYTLDAQTGRKGPARVPHPAFDLDVDGARISIRRLADLEPAAAWAGHADPVTGDVAGTLRQAAARRVRRR